MIAWLDIVGMSCAIKDFSYSNGLELTSDFPFIQAVRKASLTPYLYSLAFQAYLTGEPPVRAMELEFPHEIWSNKSALQYQFMSRPQRRDVPLLLAMVL